MNLNRPDMITNQAEKTRLDCFKEVVTKRDLCGYQCQTNSEVPLTGSPMQTPVFKPTDENLESDDFPDQDIVSLDLSQQQSAGDESEVNVRKEQSYEGKWKQNFYSKTYSLFHAKKQIKTPSKKRLLRLTQTNPSTT